MGLTMNTSPEKRSRTRDIRQAAGGHAKNMAFNAVDHIREWPWGKIALVAGVLALWEGAFTDKFALGREVFILREVPTPLQVSGGLVDITDWLIDSGKSRFESHARSNDGFQAPTRPTVPSGSLPPAQGTTSTTEARTAQTLSTINSLPPITAAPVVTAPAEVPATFQPLPTVAQTAPPTAAPQPAAGEFKFSFEGLINCHTIIPATITKKGGSPLTAMANANGQVYPQRFDNIHDPEATNLWIAVNQQLNGGAQPTENVPFNSPGECEIDPSLFLPA